MARVGGARWGRAARASTGTFFLPRIWPRGLGQPGDRGIAWSSHPPESTPRSPPSMNPLLDWEPPALRLAALRFELSCIDARLVAERRRERRGLDAPHPIRGCTILADALPGPLASRADATP